MCDYSLMHVKSRPASVGDKLRTTNFGTGTRGFAAPNDPGTAVCEIVRNMKRRAARNANTAGATAGTMFRRTRRAIAPSLVTPVNT